MMAHDPSLFAGGAALNALDDQESAQFREHLEDCPTCQAELTGFQETAARLGSASAESAPASMRAAVLARIAVTRQLPPEVSHAAVEPAPEAEPRLAEVVDLASRRRFRSRMLLTAAVTIAVALAAFSAVFLINRNSDSTDNDAAALRQCIESSSDQRQAAATSLSTGISDVTVSATCGGALIRMSDIPPLTSNQTYQLWVIAGKDVRSVGLMQPDANGTMPVTVAAVHVGDTALGMTVEPAGGSTAPSTTPVITVPLMS